MEKLEKKLLSAMAKASADFRLLEPGDRVMVAVSGGKDSHAMLYLLRELQRKAPFDFSLFALNVDQGHPGFPSEVLPEYLEREGYEYVIVKEDTYSVVTEKIPAGKTYCSLCSRLRRGILYKAASDLGCNKVALGHHREDTLETVLLNLFFGGKLAAMPARLTSDDGRHVVIRPLIYCAEAQLAALAEARRFPILPCNLCGSQTEAQRKQMKALIGQLELTHPTLRQTMLAALGNVVPTHLLDRALAGAAATAASATATATAATADPSLGLLQIGRGAISPHRGG